MSTNLAHQGARALDVGADDAMLDVVEGDVNVADDEADIVEKCPSFLFTHAAVQGSAHRVRGEKREVGFALMLAEQYYTHDEARHIRSNRVLPC